MLIKVNSSFLCMTESDWRGWISKIFDHKDGFPFVEKFEKPFNAFFHIISIFVVLGVSFKEYHKALLGVLLEKMNSESYGSKKTDEEIRELRKTLNTLKANHEEPV